jgi:hypothetical protein
LKYCRGRIGKSLSGIGDDQHRREHCEKKSDRGYAVQLNLVHAAANGSATVSVAPGIRRPEKDGQKVTE